MSCHHRGVYITLLAAAWDNGGSLQLPIEIAARSARLDPRSLRDFMAKWPRCFRKVGSKLVNEKLAEQWSKYSEISEKRRNAANTRYPANAEHKHMQTWGSASAVASASANLRRTPLTPLGGGNGNGLSHDDLLKDKRNYGIIAWREGESIVIRTNGKRRVFTRRQEEDLSICGIVENAIEKIRGWGYWAERYVKAEEPPA